MFWWSYLILVYLVIALQMALAGFLDWGRVAPNLVLPAAVFIAIHARRQPALIGAFVLGFIQDLITQQPPGLYAFSYGLAALFIVGSRPSLYRDHPLTHFALTLLAGLLAETVILFNDWAYPRLHDLPPAPISFFRLFGSALYTALLAPLLLGVLARIKRVFGFKPPSPVYGRRDESFLGG